MRYLIFLLINLSLYAHPHYFLDSTLVIKDEVIKNTWKYDRLNSRVLFFDYDKNKNKTLDNDEKKEFLKNNFYKLKDNNFNIFLANEEDEFQIVPKNVDVFLDKKRLAITFDIDYKFSSDTTICTMDEKIYLAYKLEGLETKYKNEIQKSEFDYCVGVYK